MSSSESYAMTTPRREGLKDKDRSHQVLDFARLLGIPRLGLGIRSPILIGLLLESEEKATLMMFVVLLSSIVCIAREVPIPLKRRLFWYHTRFASSDYQTPATYAHSHA